VAAVPFLKVPDAVCLSGFQEGVGSVNVDLGRYVNGYELCVCPFEGATEILERLPIAPA